MEIGYLCFEMNIKDGRGFPGISLHNPIKWSACLVRISRETNKKQLGRGQCCGQVRRGTWRGDWVQECEGTLMAREIER